MVHRPSSHAPLSVQSACALALGWLAGRDLSAAEVRLRLRRHGCPDDIIHRALEHLRFTRAIDDERVAMSRARLESAVRGRGPDRVLLRLRSIGIDPETARRAVDAVFQDLDQAALLERAIARRLKTRDGMVSTAAEYRRLYDALLRQGFPPADVRKALDRRRAKSADFWIDDPDAST